MQSEVRPVLKALGDETRFGIYDWLRAQTDPATISDIAGNFGLHPNTVRPHLERLRAVGLVELDSTPQGTVGRPQHRYRAVATDIELHREDQLDEGYALLSRMLADVCCTLRGSPREALEVGREVGTELAAATEAADAVSALDTGMERLGFGPSTDTSCVVFTSCPFRQLAEEHPQLVCTLHEGMVSGMVESFGGRVDEFHNLEGSGPCMAYFRPTAGV